MSGTIIVEWTSEQNLCITMSVIFNYYSSIIKKSYLTETKAARDSNIYICIYVNSFSVCNNAETSGRDLMLVSLFFIG